VSSLQQDVRLDAGLLDAPPDSQPRLQMQLLRKVLLEALASSRTYQNAHR
jgi:hypothetical protein